MPQIEKAPRGWRFRFTWKNTLIIIGGLIGILILVYVFLVPTPQRAYLNSTALTDKGNFGWARFELQLSNLKAFSDADHVLILSSLVAVSINSKDYVSAEKYDKQLEKYLPNNYELIMSEAYVYELMGNKSQAIADYQRVLDMMSKTKAGITQEDPAYIKNKILELQK